MRVLRVHICNGDWHGSYGHEYGLSESAMLAGATRGTLQQRGSWQCAASAQQLLEVWGM
jgi:hypothetical protein